jgi:two-component system alkaline phosphatase synthesis response regulator PhoP
MQKVMLVEDDKTMLSLLSTLLKMEGYQVIQLTTEQTVDDFIATLRRETPDLALVDVHLQHANGIELVSRVRKDPGFSAVRILMTSGLDASVESKQAGADDFILKPYMPDELIQRIRRVLQEKIL